MRPSRLEVFDFDWTLFRSPLPPPRKSERWWDTTESLLPPHVPLRPDSRFWIDEVVEELRSAQRRQDTITAIITGRRDGVAMRLRRLLEQKRLNPDFLALRSASIKKDKYVVNFKRRFIMEILDIYTSICEIELWEDVQEQLDNTKELAKRRKLKFSGHLITEVESFR